MLLEVELAVCCRSVCASFYLWICPFPVWNVINTVFNTVDFCDDLVCVLSHFWVVFGFFLAHFEFSLESKSSRI